MRSRSLIKMCVLSLLIFALTIGGAYATWVFYDGPPSPADATAGFTVNAFLWDTEEILPGGGEDGGEVDEAGQNHVALVNQIINGKYGNTNVGLNNSGYVMDEISSRLKGKNYIIYEIPSRDTLGSMAATQGSNLEKYFQAKESKNLAFLVQVVDVNGNKKISGSEGDYFYIFTMSADLLGKNGTAIEQGKWVYPVYRTRVEWVNGVWDDVGSYGAGSAQLAYYEESQRDSNIHKTKIHSIEPDSWVAGDMTK